jgi:hypothetical protein
MESSLSRSGNVIQRWETAEFTQTIYIYIPIETPFCCTVTTFFNNKSYYLEVGVLFLLI